MLRPAVRRLVLATRKAMPSVQFQQQGDSSADLTNYSFSDVPLGAARKGKINVVSVASYGAVSANRFVSAVRVAGVNADLAIRRNASNRFTSELWYAECPHNNFGTIEIDHNAGMISCSYAVWALYDLISSVPLTTAQDLNSSANIDVPAFSLLLASVHTGGGSVTMVGVNEDYDDPDLGDQTSFGHAGGSRVATASETNTTVATSGGIASEYVVAATWR